MFLRRLELLGFKSFAYKTSLEFNPGITCIVGPNGSGKSNVADAVRWVMGEQSLKILRGKKAEDVIFAGSGKKTRLGSAEVSLYIDNFDQAMPIDYSEVAICRRIFRDGEGEYLINKNLVRLQDILLLLARSNFGQRTYSIIAQGMIDSFIMASPKERKELFDEAAGVRQYQIKRDQALLKLGHTKENLNQVEILLQEIAPRLRSLTRQVRRWERREEIGKKLREKQIEYYNFLYQDIFKKHDQSQGDFLALEKVRQGIKSEIDDLQVKLETMEKESSRGELFQELQKEQQKILEKKNALLQEQVVLEGQMELDLISRRGSDLNFLRKKAEQLKSKLEELKGEEVNLRTELEESQKSLEEKIMKQKGILGEYDKIEQRLKITEEKLETKEPLELSEVKNELNQICLLQQELIKKITEIKELEGLGVIKREAVKIKERLALFLEKVKSSSPTSPKEIIEIQNLLSEQIKKRDVMVNEVNELKVTIEVKKERLDYLKNIIGEVTSEKEQVERQVERFMVDSKEERKSKLEKQREELKKKITQTEEELKTTQRKIDIFNEEEQRKKDELFALQKEFRVSQEKLNEISNKINDIKVELARFETKKEDLEHEIKEELPENFWPTIFNEKREFKSPFNKGERENEILRLKHQIELIGGIDENTQKEYQETKERHDFLKIQSDDLRKGITDLEKVIEDLNKTIENKFNQSFESISQQFSKYFKLLFNGGNAKLSLVREEAEEAQAPLDEFGEEKLEEKEQGIKKEELKPEVKKKEKVITGVEIKATPPGKKLKNINMLSGGERALSSIALICAILANNPSPFVVLDEVDAALDEANSLKFATILEDLSKRSQFIVITHNRATMEKANILYGITMGDDGISKLLSIRMKEAERVIKTHGNR